MRAPLEELPVLVRLFMHVLTLAQLLLAELLFLARLLLDKFWIRGHLLLQKFWTPLKSPLEELLNLGQLLFEELWIRMQLLVEELLNIGIGWEAALVEVAPGRVAHPQKNDDSSPHLSASPVTIELYPISRH